MRMFLKKLTCLVMALALIWMTASCQINDPDITESADPIGTLQTDPDAPGSNGPSKPVMTDPSEATEPSEPNVPSEPTKPTEPIVPSEPDPPVHHHSYSKQVVRATCTADGYTRYTCGCGQSYTEKPVAATGHEWGCWIMVKAPTKTSTGTAKRTCSKCHNRENKALDKVAPDHGPDYAYDAQRGAMKDHSAFRALKYLGFDRYGHMDKSGTLFEVIRDQVDVIDRTMITYNDYGQAMGRETVGVNVGYLNVTSATGLYPHVGVFETGLNIPAKVGLDCVDYVEYYLYNYLPNIEGVDITLLKTIRKNSKFTIDDVNFWPANRQAMIKAGVKVWSVALNDFDTTYISDQDGNKLEVKTINRYTDPDGNMKSGNEYDIYDELPIGTVIQFGNATSPTAHYAIYAGTYNGKHFMYHCGNERGPEIAQIENSWTYGPDGMKSVPLYFYSFPFVADSLPQGVIELYANDENGAPVVGAKFEIKRQDTGEAWEATTDEKGHIRLDGLSLGTYTVQEIVTPEDYEPMETVWTIKLTRTDPTGGNPIRVAYTSLTSE